MVYNVKMNIKRYKILLCCIIFKCTFYDCIVIAIHFKRFTVIYSVTNIPQLVLRLPNIHLVRYYIDNFDLRGNFFPARNKIK